MASRPPSKRRRVQVHANTEPTATGATTSQTPPLVPPVPPTPDLIAIMQSCITAAIPTITKTVLETLSSSEGQGGTATHHDQGPAGTSEDSGPQTVDPRPPLQTPPTGPATPGADACLSQLTASTSSSSTNPPTGTLFVTPSGTHSVLKGTTVTLRCQVRGGNPLATLTWHCKGSPVTGQDLTNTTTAMSSLTFTVDSTYHQQQCVCTAGHQASPNGQFGTVSVRFEVTSLPVILISPLDDPYVTRENQTGVTFTCAATSTNPPVTSIVWMKESKTLSTTGLYSLPVITKDLAGVYTCSATNDIGTTTANITMQVLSNPQMPHLLGIIDVTSSSLSIKWAVYDRSSLAVNITYVCIGCEVLKWNYVDLIDIGDIYVTTLTSLQSATQYNLTITALNLAGSSSPLQFISSTSQGDEGISSDAIDTISTPSTVLLVVGIVLILIGFTACGIGIFLYRKARLFGRSVNQQEPVTKLDTFSNAMPMETERNEEDAESSSHYQELRQYDIGKPSIYDCPSQATNLPGNRTNNPNKMTSTPSTRTQSRLHKSFTNAQKATDG